MRLEIADVTGTIIYSLVLSASITSANSDKSVSYHTVDLDLTLQHQGNFAHILQGLPGYRMVNFFDRGFVSIFKVFVGSGGLTGLTGSLSRSNQLLGQIQLYFET